MKTITKKDFLARKQFYINEIIKGKIFIYPTDTIYGIGCNAQMGSPVSKIREIKKRDKKPFSVIAPSKDWIVHNCSLDLYKLKFLRKLPGPYTLILHLKNKDSISRDEMVGDLTSIGVRIPKNWFSTIINKSSIPFITTSVNISGEKHITKISQVPKEMFAQIDYIIDCGELSGSPSKLINLSGKSVEVVKR